MPNNTPETMTIQQRYCERNKEKFLEKSRMCYEENKEIQKKMAHD